MIDKTARAHDANNVLNDETLMAALADVQAAINKELLVAKTPEEREEKWQEYHGIVRVKNRLSNWAGKVRHQPKEAKP